MNLITKNFNKSEMKLINEVIISFQKTMKIVFPQNTNLIVTKDHKNNNFLDIRGEFFHDDKVNFINVYQGDSFNMANLIQTLMHELVHLKQKIFNQLVIKSAFLIEFKGQEYDAKKIEYLNRPWEREALNLQDYLTEKYLLCGASKHIISVISEEYRKTAEERIKDENRNY